MSNSIFLGMFNSKKKDNVNSQNKPEFSEEGNAPVNANVDTKKSSFGFLNKNKKKDKEEPSYMTNNTSSVVNTVDINSQPEAKSTSFKFIKGKTNQQDQTNKNFTMSNTKTNETTTETYSKHTFTLDNLLENENIFSPIVKDDPNRNEVSVGNIEKIEKDSNINSLMNEDNDIYSQIPNKNISNILNSSHNYNDPNNIDINTYQIPKTNTNNANSNEDKKTGSAGFKFLKKKAPEVEILSNPNKEKWSQINYNTNNINRNNTKSSNQERDYQLDNTNNNEDINSDTKSFTSLRFNNNIRASNISVNLENEEDTNRSYTNAASNNISNNNTKTFEKITKTQESKTTSTNNIKGLNKDKPSNIPGNNPEIIKTRCYDELSKSEDNIKDFIMKIHNLKIKLHSREKEMQNLNHHLDNLTQKEYEAIENNNFDEAQNIENSIIDLKEKLKRINSNILDLKNEMLLFREQELILIRNKWRLVDETSNSFIKLKNSQEYELETFLNTDVNRHKNDNIKIKKMKEKLDFLKNNLDEDKTFIDEEEDKITKVIKSQSSGVFENLDQLNQQKLEILNEIESIKKILDKKYLELDGVNKSLENCEIEIDAIKSNFNHEFNKINFKKKKYDENLKDYEVQEAQYENMILVYENDKVKYEEKEKLIKNNINELGNELQKFKSVSDNLKEDLNKKEFLLKNENEINSKIHLIELNMSKISKNKEKNLEEIQNLQLGIKRLETEIISIDMRIPSLEEEKTGFVKMKNFKEAGRVSNELKSLVENKNKNLEKINQNKNIIQDLKLENENIIREIEKVSNTKYIEEKQLNITRYDYLLSYRETLNKLKTSIKKKVSNDSVYNDDYSFIEEEFDFLNEEMKVLEDYPYIVEKFRQFIEKESIAEHSHQNKDPTQKDESSNSNEKSNENSQENDCLSQEIKQTPENLEELNQEISEKINLLNEQLSKCVEEEDFDQAEKLQNEIDLLSSKLSK